MVTVRIILIIIIPYKTDLILWIDLSLIEIDLGVQKGSIIYTSHTYIVKIDEREFV